MILLLNMFHIEFFNLWIFWLKIKTEEKTNVSQSFSFDDRQGQQVIKQFIKKNEHGRSNKVF